MARMPHERAQPGAHAAEQRWVIGPDLIRKSDFIHLFFTSCTPTIPNHDPTPLERAETAAAGAPTAPLAAVLEVVHTV